MSNWMDKWVLLYMLNGCIKRVSFYLSIASQNERCRGAGPWLSSAAMVLTKGSSHTTTPPCLLDSATVVADCYVELCPPTYLNVDLIQKHPHRNIQNSVCPHIWAPRPSQVDIKLIIIPREWKCELLLERPKGQHRVGVPDLRLIRIVASTALKKVPTSIHLMDLYQYPHCHPDL